MPDSPGFSSLRPPPFSPAPTSLIEPILAVEKGGSAYKISSKIPTPLCLTERGADLRVKVKTNCKVVDYVSNELSQYIQVGDDEVTYTADGNMSSDGKFSYRYDYQNRLVEVEENKTKSIIRRNYYDPFGRKLIEEKTHEGKTETCHFTYLGANVIEAISVGSPGGRDLKFVPGDGIDEIFAVKEKGKYSFFCSDAMRSGLCLTDDKGKVLENYLYDDYGLPRVLDGRFRTKTRNFLNDRLFVGRPYDFATGLYDMRFRNYNPRTGSFIQRDFYYVLDGSEHPYGYCSCNPGKYTDRFGMSKDTDHSDMSKSSAAKHGISSSAIGMIGNASAGVDSGSLVKIFQQIFGASESEANNHFETHKSGDEATQQGDQIRRNLDNMIISIMNSIMHWNTNLTGNDAKEAISDILNIIGRYLHIIQDMVCHGEVSEEAKDPFTNPFGFTGRPGHVSNHDKSREVPGSVWQRYAQQKSDEAMDDIWNCIKQAANDRNAEQSGFGVFFMNLLQTYCNPETESLYGMFDDYNKRHIKLWKAFSNAK